MTQCHSWCLVDHSNCLNWVMNKMVPQICKLTFFSLALLFCYGIVLIACDHTKITLFSLKNRPSSEVEVGSLRIVFHGVHKTISWTARSFQL